MTTAPGWYDDGRGALRWWDGAQWTEHVAIPDAEPAAGDERQTAVLPTEVIVPAAALGTGGASSADAPGYGTYPPMASPYTPTAPSPYPGGYPAVTYPGAGGGAFVSATEPRKSNLWIVWVVLGVVVLGVVITLSVLIPMLFLSLPSGDGSSGDPSGGGTSQEPVDEPLSAADGQAAAAAVELYNEAWLTGDCDAYFASTTEAFREAYPPTDCEAFTTDSRNFNGSVDDFQTTITDVEAVGDSVAVSATETYTSLFDEDGNQTDQPVEYEDHYEYIVVNSNGVWAIDDWFLE